MIGLRQGVIHPPTAHTLISPALSIQLLSCREKYAQRRTLWLLSLFSWALVIIKLWNTPCIATASASIKHKKITWCVTIYMDIEKKKNLDNRVSDKKNLRARVTNDRNIMSHLPSPISASSKEQLCAVLAPHFYNHIIVLSTRKPSWRNSSVQLLKGCVGGVGGRESTPLLLFSIFLSLAM